MLLHKQQLMSVRYTYLNSQHVGFNIDENRTHRLCVSVEWEWRASTQRKGQTCLWTHARTRGRIGGFSKRGDVSRRGRPCWVSQLRFSSSEEGPAATNAVPDHGVNSLIFNAALHYAESAPLFQWHPLTRHRRRGEKECETLVSHFTRWAKVMIREAETCYLYLHFFYGSCTIIDIYVGCLT